MIFHSCSTKDVGYIDSPVFADIMRKLFNIPVVIIGKK